MNTNDLSLGFDPTGSSSITAAQLGQLVTSAIPSSDRGLVLMSAATPDATTGHGHEEWQRYIWLKPNGTDTVTPYVWNPYVIPDVSMLNWRTFIDATIGTYTITGGINGNIQLATITDDNMLNVSWSKVTGKPTNLLDATTTFSGVVAGTYNSLAFSGTPVTTAVINNGAVTDAKVETASSSATGITISKLRGSGTAAQMLRVGTTTYQMEFFTPNAMVTSTTVNTSTAYYVPRVNSGATAYEMVSPNDTTKPFGRLLQKVRITGSTAVNGTAVALGALARNSGTEITELKTTVTPVSSGASTFRVRVGGYVSKATNAGAVAIALCKGAVGFAMDGTAVDAIAGVTIGTTATQYVELNYTVTTGSAAAFDLRFTIQYNTATAGVATWNTASGFTPLALGFAEYEEYL